MGSELYDALAKSAANPEKRKQRFESDWFLPDQVGSMVIHEFKDISKDMKRQCVIVGEILESNPRVSGAKVQSPGKLVKKLYSLSANNWAIDQMMNDICDITGADPKQMQPESIKPLFARVFEEQALRGVVVNFRTQLLTKNLKTGKDRETPITQIFFSEPEGPVDAEGVPAEGHINHEAKVAERAAKLPA